jgi:hypothetical protein
LRAEFMIMSSRKPPKYRAVALPATSRHSRRPDPIPTVEEAKRRLAAAAGLPQPWLTMSAEDAAAVAEAEKAAGGWLLGAADWRAADTE